MVPGPSENLTNGPGPRCNGPWSLGPFGQWSLVPGPPFRVSVSTRRLSLISSEFVKMAQKAALSSILRTTYRQDTLIRNVFLFPQVRTNKMPKLGVGAPEKCQNAQEKLFDMIGIPRLMDGRQDED